MSGGCRWAGGVLPAHGGNAASKGRIRRACLLAQCAGRSAAPCAVSPARTSCSRAGDPELGGDPSLWHRGRCRHCRCRHPGCSKCSFYPGSARVAATQPLGRRRQGAWTPHGPHARKVWKNFDKIFGDLSIRKVLETLAKTLTQNFPNLPVL